MLPYLSCCGPTACRATGSAVPWTHTHKYMHTHGQTLQAQSQKHCMRNHPLWESSLFLPALSISSGILPWGHLSPLSWMKKTKLTSPSTSICHFVVNSCHLNWIYISKLIVTTNLLSQVLIFTYLYTCFFLSSFWKKHTERFFFFFFHYITTYFLEEFETRTDSFKPCFIA